MDIKKINCSYQNENLTYGDIFNQKNSRYGDVVMVDNITNHDLELYDLHHKYSKIKNYHFKEYYLNNELKFEYKIREGVSTTRNAIHLIKLAGIRLK